MPYELVTLDLTKGEGRSPAHLALHPLGEVPVLIDGDVTLFEPSAMCLYLADRFPEKGLAPSLSSPDRGPYLQWLLLAQTELEPPVLEIYRKAPLTEAQRARLTGVLDAIEHRVADREWIAGSSFSAADVVMASVLHLANTLTLLDGRATLVDYLMRAVKRPASRRAVSP